MFEKVVLRRSELGAPISPGELAEALLFYQNVHLLLDQGSLQTLGVALGMETLLSVLARPGVSATYCEEILATVTNTTSGIQFHSFGAITVQGSQDYGTVKGTGERLQFLLERMGHDKKKARKFADQFRQRIRIKKLSSDYFLPGGIPRAADKDLDDPRFLYEAIRIAVQQRRPSQTPLGNFKFDILWIDKRFLVETDLDLSSTKSDESTPPISIANLLCEVLTARADVVMAAHYGGDFKTSNTASQIIRLRHGELLRRSGLSAEEMTTFREVALPDLPSVREVIDSKERSFGKFLSLLDRSDRFKTWVRGAGPDEQLASEYLKAITAQGWLQGLPAKAIRYLISAAVGTINVPLGLGVSAGDSLLLDRLARGWRPNHFVDDRLKPFLSSGQR